MKYADQIDLLSKSIFNFNEDNSKEISDLIETTSLPRLSVYRKNLFFGVFEVLSSDYGGVHNHLGIDNFKFLVRKYLLESKIRSPNIFDFSKEFSNFLDDTYEFHKDPLIWDLSKLDLLFSYGEPSKNEILTLSKGIFSYWQQLVAGNAEPRIQLSVDETEEVTVVSIEGERCLKAVLKPKSD